ncbi:unnamed protein product [Didymodactylos carnosus]|uniref:Integrin beta n=1 Tax=Didymodactylos carnosus TaxID=1234261 RepID=A0A813RLZ7_9BILA|nr:unnamed protein product [Didymodactylos carnosus]CAF3569919.1 unnamed protein product [Didymodactylos carnosus]
MFHCDVYDNLKSICRQEQLITFRSYHELLKSDSLSNARSNSPFPSPVQLSPQAVFVHLRINDTEKIHMKFRQAEDYPVDLYYLMDLSHSMSDDKDKLSKLGGMLATEMRTITKNFRLGFGSFVDKNVPPFVQPAPNTSRPCPSNFQGACVKAYGFKHHLSLSENVKEFEHQVREAPVSGNIDAPEGGLDAIMQAIVCDNVIGWRNDSRKLIVFSTDAGFHYAGDGRVTGIIDPNDGECHMLNNEYTYSDKQDYPSIGQISSKLSEKNVNMIFAVTQSQLPLYRTLTELIDGAVVGELKNDSSNIVNLIAQNYKKITSNVLLMYSELPDGLSIKLSPDCQESKRNKPECIVSVGGTLNFSVELVATKCIDNGNAITFYIYTHGLNDRISVTVQTNCTCNCLQPPKQINSSLCSFHGNYECGVCTCARGFYGKECECDIASSAGDSKVEQCKKPGTQITCSGRGECLCGRCKCFKEGGQRIYGDYCECDDFSCPRKNDSVCSGPDHGECDCGKRCKCHAGWTGEDCSCTTNNSTCLTKNDTICNNQGVCECGKCICHKDSEFLGPTCEDCFTCAHRCADTRECVLCTVFESGSYTPEQCALLCNQPYRIDIVDSVKSKKDAKKDREKRLCQFDDEKDHCRFFYTYHHDSNQLILRVQKTKSCHRVLSVRLTIIIIVLSILLFGLFCLTVWRILATFHDRREFAKFEKEREKAKWETGVNPIYRQATVKYQNPTYRVYGTDEMRLMDASSSDNNTNNNNNSNRDPVDHSSSITQPKINSTIQCRTIYDEVRTGKCIAYDSTTNMITLSMPGSKKELTTLSVINLNNCIEWSVLSDAEEAPEPLFPVDLDKLRKRMNENVDKKTKEVAAINPNASRYGQLLFKEIKKTMSDVVSWDKNDIVVNNVRIVEPYETQNIIAPNNETANIDINTRSHVHKLVTRFWKEKATKTPDTIDTSESAAKPNRKMSGSSGEIAKDVGRWANQ